MITVTIDVKKLETMKDDVNAWPYRESHLEEVSDEMSFSLGQPNNATLIEVTCSDCVFYVTKDELQKIAILWERYPGRYGGE